MCADIFNSFQLRELYLIFHHLRAWPDWKFICRGALNYTNPSMNQISTHRRNWYFIERNEYFDVFCHDTLIAFDCIQLLVLLSNRTPLCIWFDLVEVIWNVANHLSAHDDIIKWKHFPRDWPFVWEIHRGPVNFPHKWPVTRSFDVFFDLRLNKRLSKLSWGWWFEMLSRPLWRHCNGLRILVKRAKCIILSKNNHLNNFCLVTQWVYILRFSSHSSVSFFYFASGEVLNFGLKVRSSLTLRMGVWASTESKDCLNVSLKAAINILFICLWY